MILGKPLTVGGAKGLEPIIYVNSITGSTVTCDGIQGTEVSGTWTFKTTIGTHTIVGQYDGKTQSKTVVVDAVGLYEVEIDYKLWLLNVVDGQLDECEDVTGGWLTSTSMGVAGTVTKNTDHIEITHTSNGSQTIVTSNTINVSNYSKLCIEVSSSTNNYSNTFYIITEEASAVSPGTDICTKVGDTPRQYETSISISGNKYVKLGFYWGSWTKLFKIWLE